MNIKFDRIDKFVNLVKEVKGVLQNVEYPMGIFMIRNKPERIKRLIDINNGDASKEDKRKAQIQYIIELYSLTDESARRNNFKDVQSLAEHRLKQIFNEDVFLKRVLSTWYKVTVCSFQGSLSTEKDVNSFIIKIEEAIRIKVDRNDIINAIQEDIPKIKDIESEFWSNCPSPSDVEKMCNFYHGRLSGNIDLNSIEWFREEANKEHTHLKELLSWGLIEEDTLKVTEGCFIMMSAVMYALCREVIDLFNKLNPIQPQQISNIYLSEDKGMKINYIRVINCLCELGFFVDDNKKKADKVEVMKAFGLTVNKDLESYQKDLSNALSDGNSLENNLKIFDLLKGKMTEIFNGK